MWVVTAVMGVGMRRLGGPVFFGLGHARLWLLLVVLVVAVVLTVVNNRRNR